MVGSSQTKVINWMTGILLLSVLAVISIIILGNMTSTNLVTDTINGGDVINYNTGSVLTNESAVPIASSVIVDLKDISCSLYNITNSTGTIISTGNYSIGGIGNCYVTGLNGTSLMNGSSINSTYAYTYNGFSQIDGAVNNYTSGVLTFAGFFGTSFTATAIYLILGIFIALLGLVLSLRKKMGRGKDSY